MRQQLADWQAYAESQEMRAWVQLRLLMKPMKWGLEALANAQPSLQGRLSTLTRLLHMPSEMGRRAWKTRAANQAEIAAGRPAYKGGAGKAREKAAKRKTV